MNKVLGSLDSRRDKKNFLERNDQAFMIPKKFEYQPVRRDETELVQKPVLEDLESRKVKLGERLASLRAESEEIWKSLEAAEKTLLEMVNCADYDTTRLGGLLCYHPLLSYFLTSCKQLIWNFCSESGSSKKREDK